MAVYPCMILTEENSLSVASFSSLSLLFKTHFPNVIQNNQEFLQLTFDEMKDILASGESIFRVCEEEV